MHTGRPFGTPDFPTTLESNPARLETGESIADYISCFGIDPTNKTEGSMPNCRPSVFIFISFNNKVEPCALKKGQNEEFLPLV